MNNKIDFATITACGECCVGCKKKAEGICEGAFPDATSITSSMS